MQLKAGLAPPSGQLRGADEFQIFMRAPRQYPRAMYSAPMMATANASGLRFSVETMTSPPGLTSAASAATRRRRIRNVFEHLHASHQIERGRLLDRQLLCGYRLDTQLRSCPRAHAVPPHRAPLAIDQSRAPARRRAPSPRSGCRRRSPHRERAAPLSSTARCDVAQTQRIELVQWLGRAGGIPPALRQRREFRKFSRIGISVEACMCHRPVFIRAAQCLGPRGDSGPIQARQIPHPRSSCRPATQTSLTMSRPPLKTNCVERHRAAVEYPDRKDRRSTGPPICPASSVPISPSKPENCGAAAGRHVQHIPRVQAGTAAAGGVRQQRNQFHFSPNVLTQRLQRPRCPAPRRMPAAANARGRGQCHCRDFRSPAGTG